MNGELDMGHARALLALPHAKQVAAPKIVLHGLSVREAESLVARLLKPVERKEVGRDRDVVRLEEELGERLGAGVKITANRQGAGRISIEFASLDQLDGLLRRIK